MAVGFQALTRTETADGTNVISWSPPAGELWYVDTVTVTGDGTGTATSSSVAIEAGVVEQSLADDWVASGLLGNESTYLGSGVNVSSQSTSDTVTSGSGVVGAYLTSAETLIVSTKYCRGATLQIVANLRRVL